MKKLKYVALMVIMMMVTVLAGNNVYADEYTTLDIVTIETDKEVYYEGETINLSLKFADEYYNLLDSNKKITDFEMTLNALTQSLNGGGMATHPLTPVLENAKYSGVDGYHKLYYIQIVEMAQKLKFVGGEHIADSTCKIVDELYAKEETIYDKDYEFWVAGTYYFDNDISENISGTRKEVKIVPYIAGDLTRDKEVDFFDITSLISVVYEMSEEELEEFDWRKTRAIAANTEEYTTDENYDITTAELGFMDIIYLIKTVYD